MRHQGFTLIQISVLLMVASLALVAVLPSAQTSGSANNATTTKLTALLTSLRQYQVSNGRLPCPADASLSTGANSYGFAAANSGPATNCTGGSPAANAVDSANHVAVGMVPVRALGLSNAYALDAFGRDITYAVDTSATACWPSTTLPGQIAVNDNGTTYNSIAVLVGHGADGHGAWMPLTGSTGTAQRLNSGSTDTDQLTNAHVDATFAPTTPLTGFVKKVPTASFDDLVVYKGPIWTLNNLPKSVPTITAVNPPANGNYSSGQTLSFIVTYNSPVTVQTAGGTPYLSLSAITGGVGSSNLAKASYQSGSGSAALTFSYTVLSSDSAPSGLTLTSTVTLNGGTIQSGNACATTGFTSPNLAQVIIGSSYIYVVDLGNNRVEKFDSSANYLARFGTIGVGNGQFSSPAGIAVDSSNNVWVTDWNNNRIEIFDGTGNYQSQFGGAGSGNGQFNGPSDIFVDYNGNVWVADYGNKRVQKFNSSGVYQSQVVLQSGSKPVGITISSGDSGSYLYVVEANDTVEKYTTGGTYQSVFGSAGTGNGQLDTRIPAHPSSDGNGNVWVPDGGNNRVQEFDSTGTYKRQFGCTGTGTGCFGTATGSLTNWGPAGTGIDSNGNIWVTDHTNNRMQKFDYHGNYVSQSGATGSGNGQFTTPAGIFITSTHGGGGGDGGGGDGGGGGGGHDE